MQHLQTGQTVRLNVIIMQTMGMFSLQRSGSVLLTAR